MRFWLSVALIGVIIFSCKRENEIKPEELPDKNTVSGVLIGNEGNFNWSNASLSLYDKSQKKVFNNVYKTANNKPLGDVLQSVYVDGDFAYLVVNNSGKIIKISLSDFKEVKSYDGLTSPRYMEKYGDFAFVSDLYANGISVLDLKKQGANAIVKIIQVTGWTEEMDVNENYLYVTGVTSNYVYIINMTTKTLVDSIATADAPMSLAFDKNGYLWVYCGDYQSENYVLEKIDIALKQPVLKITLPADNTQYSTKMSININRDMLFFLYDGVKSLQVDDSTITDFISGSAFQAPYGLGVDKEGNIYVADAKDYVSQGVVYVFDSTGNQKNNFIVGIIPGSFAFFYRDEN